MKDQKNQKPSVPSVIFLSWFYFGKIPKAPGTFGSLATIPLILLLHQLEIKIWALIGLITLLWVIASYVAQSVQRKFLLKDPQWIVIDEVIGMLVTWTFVLKIDYTSLILTFVTFRFFDIIKIWPASYFDKINHGIGTITDDVVSALYAGTLCYCLNHFFFA